MHDAVLGSKYPRSEMFMRSTALAQKQPQVNMQFRRPLSLVSTGSAPATGQDSAVIQISFEVNEAHAPALRSAVEEISNEVGGRLEGMYSFPIERALTNAAICLGQLRSAVCAAIPSSDPDYRGRR